MIRRVLIEGFKRFERVEFALPGHIVVAGPNNTGKTTLLQAIAAWSLALEHWRRLNDFRRHGGHYTRAPIARQAFSPVPLRAFDLLWHGRRYDGAIRITIETDAWTLPMRLEADSTEQIHVRPDAVDPAIVRRAELAAVFVPPMTGVSIDEPVYQRPRLDYLLGMGKPGDILRNLLVEAHQAEGVWPRLTAAIDRLFGYELLAPQIGHNIVAEYRAPGSPAALDIASAGSGFQQVLMLMSMLHTRPGSTLLVDEPDAHLHVILQDAIYAELRSIAARTRSQLIVATHSEVVINAVDVSELCVLLDRPVMLSSTAQRQALTRALKVLSNEDIMRALRAPGVLYVEDYTDLEILRAFARVLQHPAAVLLETGVFWKKTVAETRDGGAGIRAKDHYESLRLVRDLPALELLDGDSRPEIPETTVTGTGFQRIRWRRYEIESYLVHPDALARFVEAKVGEGAAPPARQALIEHLRDSLPRGIVERPLEDHEYLRASKARERILPPALNAAGLPNLPYTTYHEIVALMRPDEIHPEVCEKLDAIVAAFRQ